MSNNQQNGLRIKVFDGRVPTVAELMKQLENVKLPEPLKEGELPEFVDYISLLPLKAYTPKDKSLRAAIQKQWEEFKEKFPNVICL